MPAVELYCSKREKDLTVAAVLKIRLGLSWAKTKKLIEGRHIKIGGQVESNPARRVRPGLRIVVAANVVPAREREVIPSKNHPVIKRTGKPNARPKPKPDLRSPIPDSLLPLDSIVYADDSVVVVNKPAGLTTMRHSEEAEEFGKGKKFLPKTLADLLPAMLGMPNRPVIAVHRIDRDTSGLVVFARTPKAAKHLTEQFRKHTADRRYLALVRGTPKSGRIESTLLPDRGDGRRGTQSADQEVPEGKRAVTFVKVVEALGRFTCVECRLETGRTHQVRIHLGESGTPLCGERVYDRPLDGKPFPDGSGARRPMLHAARLGFTHPDNGDTMQWDVPPPEDFSSLWAELRGKGKDSNG